MEQIPTYIKAKQDPELIHYPIPFWKFFEGDLWGIVYQEQVLFIVREFGAIAWVKQTSFVRQWGRNSHGDAEGKVNFIAGANAKDSRPS